MLLVLDTVGVDRVPPVTTTSDALKPSGTSEKVKVTVAVMPTPRFDTSEVTVTEGAVVSLAKVLMVLVE